MYVVTYVRNYVSGHTNIWKRLRKYVITVLTPVLETKKHKTKKQRDKQINKETNTTNQKQIATKKKQRNKGNTKT